MRFQNHPTAVRPGAWSILLWVGGTALAGGCGVGIFNPAFQNSVFGGVVPLTPGPQAAFVLVRAVNETGLNADFIVTVESAIIERDDDGNPLIDENTNTFITRPVRKTIRLTTQGAAPSNEVGVLLTCLEEPVNVIGLGESLLPTDAAVFVGGGGVGGIQGFGVPAAGINPLRRQAGNFACGDTVIFRAIQARGVVGGVALQSFLLPGFEQPSQYSGPNTFANLERFLETQVREDE